MPFSAPGVDKAELVLLMSITMEFAHGYRLVTALPRSQQGEVHDSGPAWRIPDEIEQIALSLADQAWYPSPDGGDSPRPWFRPDFARTTINESTLRLRLHAARHASGLFWQEASVC
jgi:hypothetical protein